MQGIDYASVGLGWKHPASRIEYRMRQHRSFTDPRSLKRTQASHQQLKALVSSGGVTEETIVAAFVREIGVRADAPEAARANFGGVLAALEEE